jgi:hypothetical protein
MLDLELLQVDSEGTATPPYQTTQEPCRIVDWQTLLPDGFEDLSNHFKRCVCGNDQVSQCDVPPTVKGENRKAASPVNCPSAFLGFYHLIGRK